MKPLHPDVEKALAALELDIATGKFKNADGLREAIRAWADTQIRLALRIAGVVVEPVVEYVVNAVLTPPSTAEQEAPMMLDIQKRHNERVRSLAGGNDPASMSDAHARGLHAKDAGGRRDGCPECEG